MAKLRSFVQDYSNVWDERGSFDALTEIMDEPIEMVDEPMKMARVLFEFIAALAMSEESLPLLDSLLDVFRDNVQVAFFWKRLLEKATQFPEVFAPRLFELCIAKPIQQGNECRSRIEVLFRSCYVRVYA